MIPDVRRLIESGEGDHVEAKRAAGGLPESLWETYSAFANAQGGVILLGVSERKGRLIATGVPDAMALVRLIQRGLDDPEMASCNLLHDEDITVQDIDGHAVVAVAVPRAPKSKTPVYVGGDASSGTFIRVGEGDFRLTPEESRFYFSLRRK